VFHPQKTQLMMFLIINKLNQKNTKTRKMRYIVGVTHGANRMIEVCEGGYIAVLAINIIKIEIVLIVTTFDRYYPS
jgi:hypothetical protein